MDSHEAGDPNEHSLTQPISAPEGRGTTRNVDADAETVGEASGGFLGAVGGMAVGAVGGPIGILVGGLAGALGGWWAGHGIADALTDDDDLSFRRDYETSKDRLADRNYEAVRPAYVAGHLAGRNPDYSGESFEDVEPDLRRGWSGDVSKRFGEWPTARSYARAAFERARAKKAAG